MNSRMGRSRVSLYHDDRISNSIAGALDLLGDLSDIVRGKHVAVKPNDTWASADDLSACTQADTLETVIRYLKRLQPGRITVTGGAGAGETRRVFEYLGIDEVIRREKVEFFDHNQEPFTRIELPYGPQKEVMVNPHVLEYDTLISLAQHKVHNSATVTLTMKNIGLSYPAADYYGHPRMQYRHPHRFYDDLHGFIVGMFERFPAALGIITGHPAMVGQGPIGGRTFDTGLTIAGRDCVAVDTVGAYLLDEKNVPHIVRAGKRGLGNASLRQIEIVGLPINEALRIFKERSGVREAAGVT